MNSQIPNVGVNKPVAAVPAKPPGMTDQQWMTTQQQQAEEANRAAATNRVTVDPAAPAGTPTNPAPVAQPQAQADPGTAPPWLRTPQTDPNNVWMANQQPWTGGPNVTMTRAATDGMPDLDQDYAAASGEAADQAYAGMTQFMDEDFESDRAAAEARLVNQGFQPGSEAFNRQMSLQQRGQNDARMQAAVQAGQVGHQRAGDFIARALASRSALMGERERDADRTFAQSMGVGNLALGARGQDMGVAQARENASGAAAAAGAGAQAARERAQMDFELGIRGLGLRQDEMDFSQFYQLMNGPRGGVNMANLGGTNPLDVGSAYNIAGNNQNAQQNRNASDRGALAGLGAAALGAAGNYFSRPNTNGY
jgi:hypothetical protein